MNLLPLASLGARENPAQAGLIEFGMLLPGVTPADGTLFVRIIHEHDQFIQGIQPIDVPMTHGSIANSAGTNLGDYWSATIDTRDAALAPNSAIGWQAAVAGGGEQRYVYRYVLKNRPILGGAVAAPPDLDDIIDPFTREFGYGDVSAITVGYQDFVFDNAIEAQFKVPNIKDAVVYELNIAEFGGDIDRTIGLLDYVADLGINVIEIMPVNNTAARIDWGYDPLGYFGVASRFGRRRDFQKLVAAAHERNIAVVIDSVYGHVEGRFPYALVYKALNKTNPFVGPFAEDQFFESTDFSKTLTQDYFYTANAFWLETFRIDGFRFDDVPEYWDQARPIGQQGYSDLVLATREFVQSQAANPEFQRFFPPVGAEMTLIQIAEFLGTSANPPQHVLFDTVSNSTWQNTTMEAAKRCGRGEPGALADFGFCLGLQGYPTSLNQNGVQITKSGLQYLETHDHERFICTFGTHFPDKDSQDSLLLVGDRDDFLPDHPGRWFKVQPYLIGLLSGKGTPFLWQGQEFCQNYDVPDNGQGRVGIYRPVDFNFFYDPVGKALVRLVRKLIRIRAAGRQFTDGDHSFINDAQYVNNGLLLFTRSLPGGAFSLIALNFTDADVAATFTFPKTGIYTEEIEGVARNLAGVVAGVAHPIVVPSNYGAIWTN